MTPTATDLQLDEATHRYTDGSGRVIPSTTQIISEVRTGFRYHVDPWYLERGRVIHSAVELAAKSKLDLPRWENDLRAALSPEHVAEIIGKTKAALLFLTENMQADKCMQELILHNSVFNYAGKADLIGFTKDGRWATIDWKSSVDAYVQLQLGGYSLAQVKKPEVVCGVELKSTGQYRAIWGSRKPKQDKAKFDLEHAERRFIAALTFRGFLVENNLLAAHMEHVEEVYNAAN
jgi:hypothetical protein